jgi:hypothetical protein
VFNTVCLNTVMPVLEYYEECELLGYTIRLLDTCMLGFYQGKGYVQHAQKCHNVHQTSTVLVRRYAGTPDPKALYHQHCNVQVCT